ncbi:MAG: DNA glycosylase [Thermoplasmatales archaeon]|nr:DNA glycosylase [Thermoplasmatales archaeon]
MSTFSIDLLKWWSVNARHFPWREERDPYNIMIAEILLHRTRAENVVPIYLKFITEFPNVKTLSEAYMGDIFKILRPLGLAWRVNLLKRAATIIEREFSGQIPMDKEKLLGLPGIGDYIASAIRVFSGYADDPLLDTNTVRIICRIYGIPISDGLRRERKLKNLYRQLKCKTDSKVFAFSLIDLAAEVCHPRLPECDQCPVSTSCATFQPSLGGSLKRQKTDSN